MTQYRFQWNLSNLKESEEDHGLVQHLLHLRIAQALHPLLQLVVDEER